MDTSYIEPFLIIFIPILSFMLAFLFAQANNYLIKKAPFLESNNIVGTGIIASIFISLLFVYIVSSLNDFNMIELQSIRIVKKLIPSAFLIICLALLQKQYKLKRTILFFTQILIAFLAWRQGIIIDTLFGVVLGPVPSCVVTVVWFLFIFNVFNYTDGIGGFALIQCMLILLVFLTFCSFRRELPETLFVEILFAVCFSFYLFARRALKPIMMGAIGTQFMGFCVGVLSVYFFQKSLIIISIFFLVMMIIAINICSILIALWKKSSVPINVEGVTYPKVMEYIDKGLDSSEIVKKFRMKLLGVPFDYLDTRSVLRMIEYHIATSSKEGSSYILAVNPIKIYSIREKPFLKEFFEKAFLLIPDGIGIIKAAYMIFGLIIERVAGSDLMEMICRISAEKGYKSFIFGAKEEINKTAIEKLKIKYPGTNIVGRENGYVRNMGELVNKINMSKADILFIGLGSPAQEEWIYQYSKELTTVKICQGVGGTIDTIAGNITRAPDKWQKLGLEWLFRILKEPKKRMSGFFILLRFIFEVFVLTIVLNNFLLFYSAMKKTGKKGLRVFNNGNR